MVMATAIENSSNGLGFAPSRGRTRLVLAVLCMISLGETAAQTASDRAALAAFDGESQRLRALAPDEVVARLRHRAVAVLSRLPQFDPGGRAVDLIVEYPWATLRRRCPPATPMDAVAALRLVDQMLEAGEVSDATAADRGALAALVAVLDGRLCRCKDKSSLALAAECAS